MKRKGVKLEQEQIEFKGNSIKIPKDEEQI